MNQIYKLINTQKCGVRLFVHAIVFGKLARKFDVEQHIKSGSTTHTVSQNQQTDNRRNHYRGWKPIGAESKNY